MRQVVMHAPGDVRVEDREDPTIIEPTDAIIRLTATCICGSDLWPYRGAEPVDHQVVGHEYVGVVEEIGSEVGTVKVGDLVVGSFWASDNTCEICQAGYQAYCVHRVLMGTIGTQSELARIPLADATARTDCVGTATTQCAAPSSAARGSAVTLTAAGRRTPGR